MIESKVYLGLYLWLNKNITVSTGWIHLQGIVRISEAIRVPVFSWQRVISLPAERADSLRLCLFSGWGDKVEEL